MAQKPRKGRFQRWVGRDATCAGIAAHEATHGEREGLHLHLLACLLLLPDLLTDAFVLMLWKLIAHLVDDIFQMFFQGFIF